MIHLRTFGDISLSASDGGAHKSPLLDHPKRLALFLYLAREPGLAHQRDSLLAVFWPESTAAHARNSLRQSLHVIRSALGDTVVLSQGSGCVIVPHQLVTSDISAFHGALATDRMVDALELYRGEFLSGFYLKGAPTFERWVDTEREHAKRLAADAASRHAGRLEKKGDYQEALRYFERARELSPFNEWIARRHIWLLAAVGNRGEAVDEYRTFCERLRVDLGVLPSTTTASLGRRIRTHTVHPIDAQVTSAH